MHHVAIMRRSWGLTAKIALGKKTAEFRFSLTQRPPWDRIKKSDLVFFKDSGSPVTVKVGVEKVLQVADLNPKRIKTLLTKYGRADGIEGEDLPRFYKQFRNKKYCVLIFLKKATPVKPFEINKAGFGSMSAWITIPNINNVKKPL
ncbi:MAG: hypothetical protein ACM3KM_01875 [Acidobacteriaceae bacterium]